MQVTFLQKHKERFFQIGTNGKGSTYTWVPHLNTDGSVGYVTTLMEQKIQ